MSVPNSAILPTPSDCNSLCDNYVILMARTIIESVQFFKFLRPCVPEILHCYSNELAKKSETVSLYCIIMLLDTELST